jgi:hypothetical protein
MKNTFLMKTVTAWDLQTRLPTILAWLEAGEEVMVKPKAKQEESPMHREGRVAAMFT